MNWGERETRVQLALSCVIMACALIGAVVVVSMAVRNEQMFREIRKLSAANVAQARAVSSQAEAGTAQAETNRNLSREVSEARRRQDVLKRVAERLNVPIAPTGPRDP